MSLRAAKFADHWRTAFARAYPDQVGAVTISNSRSVLDTRFIFRKGIIALVGANGVGKSTLAHAIASGLARTHDAPDLVSHQERIRSATVDFEIRKGDVQSNRRVTFNDLQKEVTGEETIDCNWFDPSLFAVKCRDQILGDAAFDDVLDGITPKDFSEDQLALASYIVGKNYIGCRVWEISEYGPFENWPYFEVKTIGAQYSSEAMGQGELALLSALWSINRCANNSITVVEEPETHASARSQAAFMDFIARESATRGMTFLVTTHSPVILQKIPLDNTFLFLNDGRRSEIFNPPRFHHLSSLLGGGTAYKALLVVEDEAAKVFCDTLLSALAPDLSRQVVYAVATDGESEIVRILRTMPLVHGWGKLIGCFDGDQRVTHNALHLPWPHIFLPTDLAPDAILLESLRQSDKTLVATELAVERADLMVGLATVEGLDHHDWARDLSIALNIATNTLFKVITRIWVRDNDALVRQFVADLTRALG